MKAVITVIGQDKVGIIAKLSQVLADANVNILDITQTTTEGMFTMILWGDISKCSVEYSVLSSKISALGEEIGLYMQIQHEDVFKSMHRI